MGQPEAVAVLAVVVDDQVFQGLGISRSAMAAGLPV